MLNISVSDCHVLHQHIPSATSGIYLVKQDTLHVYCDMDTDGGGWTVSRNYVVKLSSEARTVQFE